MCSWILILVSTTLLYSTVQSAICTIGNPCDLGGHFVPANGYECVQLTVSNARCTCPGGYEINRPCRICNRLNPQDNVCQNTTGKLVFCLEINYYGTSYGCLCTSANGEPFVTSDTDCAEDIGATLTTTATTTRRIIPSPTCFNGGEFIDGICHCPSGYSGPYCATRNERNLCDRIYCKNNGVCGIRNPSGPPEGVCLCRYGTLGDYCEVNGTLGYCSSISCLNGGFCKENVVATTRHAYCFCLPGYRGFRCEDRYFTCPRDGTFTDVHMFDHGKYFVCTNIGGSYRLEQKSCPKGLRYNMNRAKCTY